MAFSQIIARLGVQLGMDTASFETGSRKAQREVTTLAGKMKVAGAAISGALVGLGTGVVLGGLQSAVTGAFELASSLSEAAARIGLTVEALQEMRLAAQETGVSNEDLESSMARLNVQLGDLQAGGKTAAKAFEAIGLTAKDLKGLAPDQAFAAIADKLMAIEDPSLRAAAAQDIFGKSYSKLLPLIEGGSKALAEFAEQSRKQGQVSTEDAKKLDELADSWENFKTRAGVATANLIANLARYNDTVQSWVDAEKAWEDSVVAGVQRMATAVVDWIGRMVNGITTLITGTLGAVWTSAMAKIEQVKDAFFGLYDAVVGHSYIPDMVDGIDAQMKRLDTVMVGQAGKATSATAKKFKDLRDMLDRLFPEAGKAGAFNADLARIAGSGLNDNEKNEASARLWREFLSGSPFGSGGMGGPDFGSDGGPLVEGMGSVGDAIERLTAKARIGTVRIADSFKDMAQNTLQSLSSLTSAIKSGGFLSILEAVIGFGLQLGSTGLFGKTIAGRLNGVPGYANGTNFHPGGLAMVGERGPELVSMPRGSKVYANAQLGGRQLVEIVDTTGLFRMRVNGQILEAAPAIAQAGAQGGVALGQYRASRRWR